MLHASTSFVLAVFLACSLPAGAQTVAALGDVDGDGAVELLVGRSNPGTSGPSVGVFSSRDGRRVHWLRSDDGRSGFGTAVARWCDLDGDGVDDFAVGAPGTDYPGGRWWPRHARRDLCGLVYVYSGRTGQCLRRHTGLEECDGFGHALASADFDGDGRAELIVGSPGGRRVCVFDGASGECTWRFERPEIEHFGRELGLAGDLDLDGATEFLVGAPGDATGTAWVLTLATDGLERRHSAAHARRTAPALSEREWRAVAEYGDSIPTIAELGSQAFGATVAGIGDVDGDRTPDYVVGARGVLHLHSGATGGEFAMLRAARHYPSDTPVVALGDVDADGVPDFAVGDANAERPMNFPFEEDDPLDGAVTCVSGCTLNPLWLVPSPRSGSRFGAALARVPDVDRDGADELLVEAGGLNGDAPSFHLVSGRTGAELHSFSFPGDAAVRMRRDTQR